MKTPKMYQLWLFGTVLITGCIKDEPIEPIQVPTVQEQVLISDDASLLATEATYSYTQCGTATLLDILGVTAFNDVPTKYGKLKVSNDKTYLYIYSTITKPEIGLWELYYYIGGLSAVPQNENLYPYKIIFAVNDKCAFWKNYTFRIPLSRFGTAAKINIVPLLKLEQNYYQVTNVPPIVEDCDNQDLAMGLVGNKTFTNNGVTRKYIEYYIKRCN